MKKINNKGYMLVEIIVAFALTFTVVYFIMDLVLKLKSKNDDLLVETLVETDRTIISNKLMDYAIDLGEDFDCTKLTVSGNVVKYNGELINILNKYTKTSGTVSCSNNFGKVSIIIPLNVPQIDDDFDVLVDYKYKIGDMIPPTCKLSATKDGVTFSEKKDNVGVTEYGLSTSSSVSYNGKEKLKLSSNTFYGYVKDDAGNEGSCSIKVKDASHNGYNVEGYCYCAAPSVGGFVLGSCRVTDYGSTWCYCSTTDIVDDQCTADDLGYTCGKWTKVDGDDTKCYQY